MHNMPFHLCLYMHYPCCISTIHLEAVSIQLLCISTLECVVVVYHVSQFCVTHVKATLLIFGRLWRSRGIRKINLWIETTFSCIPEFLFFHRCHTIKAGMAWYVVLKIVLHAFPHHSFIICIICLSSMLITVPQKYFHTNIVVGDLKNIWAKNSLLGFLQHQHFDVWKYPNLLI